MIIIFAIVLASAVTNSQGKNIALLSNEEFPDKLTRRAGERDNSYEDIGNRDDKSYIPDVDLALTDIYLRSYTGVRRENSADEANLNETTLPLHEGSVDDHNKVTDEKEKMNPENNTLEPETPDSGHSDTENITEESTTILSTTLADTNVILSMSTTESYIHDSSDGSLTFKSTTPVIDTTINEGDVFNIFGSEELITPTDESTTSVIDTTINESDVFHIFDSQATTQNVAEVNTATTEDYSGVTEKTEDHSAVTEKTEDYSVVTEKTEDYSAGTEKTEDYSAVTEKIEDYSAVTENSSINENSETVIETTSLIPLTPTIEEEQNTNKQKKISNTVIHAVNEIENVTKSERCNYCYRVYEILFPTKRGNQLFFRSQEQIKNQRHLIPVYKYLRNSEYYNPKKRLGPNEVEKKSIELDIRQHRKINDTAEVSELLTKFNESRKFVVFKRKHEISKKSSDELAFQFERQGSDRKKPKNKGKNKGKNKVKKLQSARLFDETNSDILPELMHAILGAESMDVPIIETYKDLIDMNRPTRIDNLLDFINGDSVKFEDMTIRKRSNDESEINIHIKVLTDLILEDSKALKQYDWLATTVQIQSVLSKMLKLINRMRQSELIHPADLQILNYVVFLHNFSLGIKEDINFENESTKLRKKMKLLSRNKKKRKNQLLKEKGLINRVGLYLRTLLPGLVEEDEFSHLYEFLIDVKDGLFGLHEAIRHIADVTKFDRQNWYGDLKQLYLSADEKHLRELLLHISMSRLVDLVEHRCKQGLDNDVVQYLQTHEKEAKRIVEEMLFIDKIVDELEINTK